MASDVAPLVDRLLRKEAARLTALLTRLLGVERIELAEAGSASDVDSRAAPPS